MAMSIQGRCGTTVEWVTKDPTWKLLPKSDLEVDGLTIVVMAEVRVCLRRDIDV